MRSPSRRPTWIRIAASILVLLALAFSGGSSVRAAPRTPASAVAAPNAPSVGAAGDGIAARRHARSAIRSGSVDRTSINLRATYEVTARLQYDEGSLGVDSTMEITNTSGGPIDRLELNVVPARLGSMRLDLVTVDGSDAAVTRSDQTLRIALGGILAEGDSATVRVIYKAWFRSSTGGSDWLFAKRNGIVSAYRWIPWVSRERDFDRPNHGDPFFTPSSPSVRVTFLLDRDLKLATSGRKSLVEGLTRVYVAEDVRDFNFTASPTYKSTSTTSADGDTTIQVFFRAGSGSTMRTWARRAFDAYEDWVGEYPWASFTIGQSPGGYAMESPAHVWIPYGLASSSVPYLVAHETAHQWFYGVVGNDQAREPYADEAPADFLARNLLGTRRSSRCGTATLDRTIYEYGSSCYYEVIYIQGGNFLNSLRLDMGGTRFWGALGDYYAANRFGLSGTRALLEAIRARAQNDPLPLYRERFPRLY